MQTCSAICFAYISQNTYFERRRESRINNLKIKLKEEKEKILKKYKKGGNNEDKK